MAKLKRHNAITALLILFIVWGCVDQAGTDPEQHPLTEPATPSTRISHVPDDMALVPAGEFLMGSDLQDTSAKQQEYGLINPLYLDEHPQHKVNIGAYYIDKMEVTNQQYKRFIKATKSNEPFQWSQNGYNLIEDRLLATDLDTLRWIGMEYFRLDVDTNSLTKNQLLKVMRKDWAVKDRLPVTGVNWFEAQAYCRWLGKNLPTEQQWEKAARGADGLKYPWGNEWNVSITNTGDDSNWEEGVAPVGSYPGNASPYDVYDLAGNVWEWVADWYQAYPGSQYEHSDFGTKFKVVRGGGGGVGHYALSTFFRGSARSHAEPRTSNPDVGFRCAKPKSE